MTDGCDIDVDADDPDPIEIEVGPDTALDVDIEHEPEIEVSSRSPDAITVEPTSVSDVDVELTSLGALDVDTDAMDEDLLEVLSEVILGLSASEQARLYSKAFGEKPGKAPLEIWSIAEKAVNGFTGDSIQWAVTTTKQEIARGIIHAPMWRSRGYLDIDLSAKFTNNLGSGTTFYSRVKIETMPWPNSTFPEVWTTRLTMDSGTLNEGAGSGIVTYRCRLRAAGHAGATFTKATDYWVQQSIVPNGVSALGSVTFGGDVSIDTSRSLAFRITIEAPALIALDHSMTVTSTNANLFNYEDPNGGN